MNKADLERALKKTTGAALKPVIIILPDGTPHEIIAISRSADGGVILHYKE